MSVQEGVAARNEEGAVPRNEEGAVARNEEGAVDRNEEELNTSPTTPSPRVPDQPYFKVRGLAVPQKCRAQQRGLVPQGLHVYFDQQAAFSSKPAPRNNSTFYTPWAGKIRSFSYLRPRGVKSRISYDAEDTNDQSATSRAAGSRIDHELCQLIIRISYLNAWDLAMIVNWALAAKSDHVRELANKLASFRNKRTIY
ncbi:hypothetical protein PGT21_034103 [Puccinia graminis f. sp. tritici]|uniref:Uncharacterized protein n=1 Tax=Puccinia graminis f. sp. tritici TaxID=56615 RepID=A0A5B0MHW0_PUCGR|nr:hypothetical protein PGT21_034103 [Puccinia graminis f. sp. tritici]